jgi:predicted nucleic-acid-binding protein
MIDTEIWSIAKKKPLASNFSSQKDYLKALRMHEEALKFFREKLPELEVYISTNQIGEIYHVLAFRGTKVPKEEAMKIVWAILEDDKIIKVPLLPGHLKDALEESAKTGIHIWDYLCFFP